MEIFFVVLVGLVKEIEICTAAKTFSHELDPSLAVATLLLANR